MGNPVTKYEHHGKLVYVRPDLKGTHRAHCLCFHPCMKFKPENREENCPIANELFALDVKHSLATPVFECPQFQI